MDYEFRIQLAEKELAHLQEMQRLARARQDTTDSRLESIEAILLRTEANIEILSQQQINLHQQQLQTGKMLQDLIQAIARDHPNGGEKRRP